MSRWGRLVRTHRRKHIRNRRSLPPCRARLWSQSPNPQSLAQRYPALLRRPAHSANKQCILQDQTGSRGLNYLSSRQGGFRHRSHSVPRAGPLHRPCPAVRNRRWRNKSGNPADGRRYKAPSRHAAVWPAWRFACAPPCPLPQGLCMTPAYQPGLQFPPGTAGRNRNYPAYRWRRVWVFAYPVPSPRALLKYPREPQYSARRCSHSPAGSRHSALCRSHLRKSGPWLSSYSAATGIPAGAKSSGKCSSALSTG